MGTDATTSDGHDADLLVRLVAEFVSQPLPIGELGRIKAGDVAGEVEVLLSPFTNHRQIRAEAFGHDVARVPDEQRTIPRIAGTGQYVRSSRRCSRRSGTPRVDRRRA